MAKKKTLKRGVPGKKAKAVKVATPSKPIKAARTAAQQSADKLVTLAVQGIEKDFGKGTVMRLGDDRMLIRKEDTIPSGSLGLDVALGIGGMPRGRVVEIYGPESCLAAKTFVQYEVRTQDGKHQNHKGGSIERLYHRFNGIPIKGKGSYQRPETVGSEYFAPSVNDEGRIFQNKIVAVVDAGEKHCFELETNSGEVIQASADHKFFTGEKYVPLSDLQEGDTVMIHNATPYRKAEEDEESTRTYRHYLYVKEHPVAGVKIVKDDHQGYEYTYHRLARARAVVEARMNKLSLDEFVGKLNDGDVSDLNFLSRDDCVHHVDEDHTNDAWENLVVVDASSHGRRHAIERHNNLRYAAVPARVRSVRSIGQKQTYDIQMESPSNNYVAERFVVHNSGKTTLALSIVGHAQAKGLVCAFVDAEHALDPSYAEVLGVHVDDLLVSQPDCGEQALEIVERLTSSTGVGVIVVDSVAALTPRAELEGDMGDTHMGLHARLMSQAMRKLTGTVSKSKTMVVFINQTRMKIGVVYGNPEVTTGGNALKFYASVRLEIRRIGAVKKGENIIGNRTRVRVVKNKCSPPFKKAEFDLIYGKGISYAGELLDIAVEQDVIDKSGAWYSYGTERIGQGRENACAFLEAEPAMLDEIREKVLG